MCGKHKKKKERIGKTRFYHERNRKRKHRRAMKSWKKDYLQWFVFDPDRYPFYFPK